MFVADMKRRIGKVEFSIKKRVRGRQRVHGPLPIYPRYLSTEHGIKKSTNTEVQWYGGTQFEIELEKTETLFTIQKDEGIQYK